MQALPRGPAQLGATGRGLSDAGPGALSTSQNGAPRKTPKLLRAQPTGLLTFFGVFREVTNHGKTTLEDLRFNLFCVLVLTPGHFPTDSR